MSFCYQAKPASGGQPYPCHPPAMPSLQPYEDLPGIDEEGFAYEHFRTNTPHMAANFHWATLDPTMEQNRYAYDYGGAQPAKSLLNMREHLVELEHFANGYGYPTPMQIPEQGLSRLEIHSPWSEQYRNMRYQSPNGHFGGTLSSDSSPSERAYSPDLARHQVRIPVHSQIGGNTYPSPAIELSYIGTNNNWSQPSMFMGELASPCLSSQTSAACNLKDLEYIPDSSVGEAEDHFDDADTIRVRINVPEEIILSPDVASASDSGLGESLDDNMSFKDEDDEIAVESDNDTEYTPTRAGRNPSMNTRRPSIRSPRRQRSLQTSTSVNTVLDPKTRVTKSSNRKASTATPSKKAAASKADKADAKVFTCTFHHYGCDAKFASKNEWKRHVASQHLQLGFFRCDVGPCIPDHHHANGTSSSQSKGYNDFNRKDLFTQHHRRMHTPWGNPKDGSRKEWEDFEAGLEDTRNRCWRVRREPPKRSGCGFCGRVFEDGGSKNSNNEMSNGTGERSMKRGENKEQCAWEERMEHVGKHFERLDWEVEKEREDEDLTRWAIREGVVRDLGEKGCWLVGMEPVEAKHEGVHSRRRGRRSTLVKNEAAIKDEEEDAQGEDE